MVVSPKYTIDSRILIAFWGIAEEERLSSMDEGLCLIPSSPIKQNHSQKRPIDFCGTNISYINLIHNYIVDIPNLYIKYINICILNMSEYHKSQFPSLSFSDTNKN